MKQRKREDVDPKEMIALEQELAELKDRYDLWGQTRLWVRMGDWIAQRSESRRIVNRKKYIRLALCFGWFCGAHRFYSGQKILGMLYLLFCWTGIAFTMTLIDLMIVLPMKPDEQGLIEL